MRISKSTKTSVTASSSTSDYKQCLKDALVAKGGYSKSDVADQSTATLESWAKDAGIDIDNVCACGDIKASKKVCASLEGKTVKIKPYAEIKDMGWFVDDMKPYCGRTCEVIHDLANGFVQLDEIDFENRKLRQWEWSPEGLDVIENTNSSTSTDKALQHIKAAIDILGKSGNKDAVTKDSIANLGVVMLDIKANTISASTSKCKYSKKECIDAIQYQYGMNKREADEYYKTADCKLLEALVEGFKGNAKRTFYND